MKSAKANAKTASSQGAAKLLFFAGTLLVLGAGAVALDRIAKEKQLGLDRFISGAVATPSAPVFSKPLIAYMPPAYERWQRTDYVEPKAAVRALDRFSSAMRLPGYKAAEGGAAPQDAALAHFDGPGAQFVIFIERTPASEWAPPKGPVSIVGGKIFRNHSPGAQNVVDISLERPDGLSVVVRGRGKMATVWTVLKELGFWSA